ncbi:monovalent cation:proton antiporter-2 (CPA2) family protein [Glaciecola petra]|uniref:Monovalent cation:proton antiporter-2 (CPA2) family protein n=1 Tax=Glaciecola petra TaxID=3075602 RepID=A0ABU2ZMD1_9ALTE|nr:monovalent cation:proton antiporter-2 (CPA2) family protein [Aestuariibacter sp. P117]MDT0593571.1 monovalent cation:proton antiporter-2 (CPA2) family protein [Aestuariibacter sp. P117]
MTLLPSVAIFLGATLIAVPLFKKFKLGAILGYLVAGVLIGPSGLNLITDIETILHFSELGVVLLLFVIGLELEPSTLWRMRNQIIVSGGSQLLVTALVLALISHFLLGLPIASSVTIGLALALSSTAFAIQLMNEQRILNTPPGQQGFSMLLMQDVAVIPILLIVGSFSTFETDAGVAWYISLGAVVAVLIAGKFLVNPVLRIVANYGSSEVMTAAALFLVLVTALAMSSAGLSMGMGAFLAGILLANSSFKHQLEVEIEPFKGLLLGLFFIAIGMNLNLSLLIDKPIFIVSMSLLLVLIKAGIISSILLLNKQNLKDASRVGLLLSQGGEFAFVVMTLALSSLVLTPDIAAQVNLVVGISMAVTSPLVILHAQFFSTKNCPAVYESESVSHQPQVIIAGFGRFGQITARVLAANSIPFTALDKDAEHIEFVRKFGNKVFFGDASRLDMLEKAGIADARILLVAIDEPEQTLNIIKLVKQHYPKVNIVARARNRNHAEDIGKLGLDDFVREMFDGGLVACEHVLKSIGYSNGQAKKMTVIFAEHDAKMLEDAIKSDMNMETRLSSIKQGREELQQLFVKDSESS